MKEKIEVDGVITWVRKLHLTEKAYKDRMKYQKHPGVCPLCRKDMVAGDDTYLLINNYKLFPNTSVHERCVETTWPLIIKRLINDWQFAETSRKYNRCWYGET